MNLVSFQFALFFLLVLPLNWLLRSFPLTYRCFLLCASYIFYGSISLSYLLVLVHFSFWTWVFGEAICRARSATKARAWLVLHLLVGLGGLAFFKYFDLLYDSMDLLLVPRGLGNPLPQWDIILPIGISFFTFQGLSYTIDVYRERQARARTGLDVFVFVAFFPTLLNGPILRARTFLPQLMAPGITRDAVANGLFLIISGLFKKLVVASYLSEHLVARVFESPGEFSSLGVAIGALGYSVQILFDFSGFTDLVLGIGLLMGFTLPDNFDFPYSATNLRQFWRRWHISFSTWLRDYLYISMGGNRKGKVRTHANLLVTMLLGGLWHGAGFNFIVWGLLHGIGLSATHIIHDVRSTFPRRGYDPAAWLWKGGAWAATLLFVTLAWVFFGASSFTQAMDILQRIATWDMVGEGAPVACVVLIALALLREATRFSLQSPYVKATSWLPGLVQGCIAGILISLILRLGPDGVPQFIYFQF